MKKVSLSGSRRANVGSKDASELRKNGRIPCVVYGGKEQVHFHAKENDLNKIVWSPEVFEVTIDLEGGGTERAVIQEIQFHPVNNKLVHVDFLHIQDDKAVKVSLPVKVKGAAEGVKKGGKLYQNYRKLAVLGLPKHLPEVIEANIDNLNIGDDIRVKDLNVEGLTFLDTPASVVVAVKTTRNVAEEPAAAAPATAGAAPAAKAAAPAAKAPAKK